MTGAVVVNLLLSALGVGAVALIALALRPLARRDATLRYRLMRTALLCALLLIPLQAIAAQLDLLPRPASTAATLGPELAPGPVGATVSASPVAIVPASASPPARAPAAAPRVITPEGVLRAIGNAAPALLTVYLTGLAAAIALFAARAHAARRLLRQARHVANPRVLHLWQRVTAGRPSTPALLECDGLNAPACRGVLRPAVILPATNESLDDDTLLAGLRHELVHLDRRDEPVAILASALAAALWFQPLAWVFARLLAADREHSCDAQVVRATRRPRAYAMALLQFCDPAAPRGVLLIGFESARSIRRRITMLPHASTPARRSRHALVLVLALAGLGAASTAHALLTSAAHPGLSRRSALAVSAAGQTEEIPAPEGGRSDAEVANRFRATGVLPDPACAWAYPIPAETSPGVRWPGSFATEEDRVLVAQDAQVKDGLIHANRFRLTLPNGSKLKAVLDGTSIVRDAGAGRVVVGGGAIKLVDESGVTRIRISAADGRGAGLVLASVPGASHSTYEVTASDGAAALVAKLDTAAGVPEGEQRPPHGAARWRLVSLASGVGQCWVEMQWTYDLIRLRNEGC